MTVAAPINYRHVRKNGVIMLIVAVIITVWWLFIHPYIIAYTNGLSFVDCLPFNNFSARNMIIFFALIVAYSSAIHAIWSAHRNLKKSSAAVMVS
jgi:hypothetical protein